jgi:hypothetical protein
MPRNVMGCECGTQGERKAADRVFVGKPEGKRQLGKSRLR